MRILHLADRWTDRGGAYLHLRGLIAHQSRDHDVALAVGREEGTPPASPLHVIPGLEARVREGCEVEALVEETHPHVVHLHNVVNPVALEGIARLRGVAKVVTVQDHRFFCPTRGKWTTAGTVCGEAMSRELCAGCFSDERYFEEIYSLTAERLEALAPYRVIVLSRYMERELLAAGLDGGRLHVVPPFVHGLDLDAAPGGPPVVLFAGRLVEAKGVRDAVAAWRLAEVDLPLVVAGTGPLRKEMEEEGVEVLGWVPHELMGSLYRRAAAVLLPPRWQEPFGIAGLEALTMGAPVVAWESGGIAEWHPGPLTGWGDVDALAGELRRALGRCASPPAGFEPAALMSRLHRVYDLDARTSMRISSLP